MQHEDNPYIEAAQHAVADHNQAISEAATREEAEAIRAARHDRDSDPAADLLAHCRSVETIVRVVKASAYPKVIEHLWDEAWEYGGVMNPPPEQPSVVTKQDALAAAARLVAWLGPIPLDLPQGSPGGSVAPSAPPVPAQYLMSWREILDALGLKNTAEDQRRVRQLNDQYDGPIALPGRGGQPKVDKDKLLSWWNGLEARFHEIEGKNADAEATLQARHAYGRNQTVLPDISGHIKSRRRKKRDP